jgi:hypothetical protein
LKRTAHFSNAFLKRKSGKKGDRILQMLEGAGTQARRLYGWLFCKGKTAVERRAFGKTAEVAPKCRRGDFRP